MDSPDTTAWWATAITAAIALLAAFLTRQRSGPKTFNLPVLGIDTGDANTLKTRYVQEADVLLREGYHKVKYSSCIFHTHN